MSKIINALTLAAAKYRRKTLSASLFNRYEGIVQRGPYAGLRMSGDSNVSKGPLAAKIFGLYEPLVVETITKRAPFKDFINFGAADGYMSLGPLVAGYCQRSICFELTAEGRAAVADNAKRNEFSDRVEIRGAVTNEVAEQLEELLVDPKDALILCDIEGAEFTELTCEVLASLKGATMIIELHDVVQNGVDDLRKDLIARFPKEAITKVVAAEALGFDGIEDLESMHDIDRSLVLSEGRRARGEWLIVTWDSN